MDWAVHTPSGVLQPVTSYILMEAESQAVMLPTSSARRP
jgi:hypothetical protein